MLVGREARVDALLPAMFARPTMTFATPMRRSRALSLANLLTYGRILSVPAVVVCLYWPNETWMRWLALALFIAAGVTDFLDGWVARAWSQQSAIGRMLDPIADKVLVAASLLMLVADATIKSWSLWAAIIILAREILVSGLREFLAELRAILPVNRLAKWKTGMQMTALGFLIVADAQPTAWLPVMLIGEVLLWVAAVLTLITGYDYLAEGLKHVDDKPVTHGTRPAPPPGPPGMDPAVAKRPSRAGQPSPT